MPHEEKIEAVKKITKALSSEAACQLQIESAQEAVARERFDIHMSAEAPSAVTQEITLLEEGNKVSLIEESSVSAKTHHVAQSSPEKIQGQVKDLLVRFDEVKVELAGTQAQIPPSYQTLLRHRLSHIDENIKIALSKAGAEARIQPLAAKAPTPGERFINLLSHGQYQLEHLNQTVETLSLANKELSPANMLALQIKVGQIQQEIELFTSLLNKALESTKTLMNVQV